MKAGALSRISPSSLHQELGGRGPAWCGCGNGITEPAGMQSMWWPELLVCCRAVVLLSSS